MTPEQLDHAAQECAKAIEELWFSKRDGRSKAAISFLKKIVVFAKAATPSGQVAEDEKTAREGLHHLFFATECTDPEKDCRHNSAISRLATQAQSAENYRAKWQEAEAEANTLRRNLADAQKDVAANAEEVERLCRATSATLSVRDEFAKAAMHTVVVACKGEIDEGILRFADVARRAYRLADAMLKARETK